MRREIFYPIWRWPLRRSHLERIGSSSSKEGSRANFISLHRGIHSFWKRMVRRGEREREREPVLPYSRGFHLEVNVMVRWSLRATRTIPQPESLEECQCQGLARPRGDNETSSQSRVGPPQCFETILIASFAILGRSFRKRKLSALG